MNVQSNTVIIGLLALSVGLLIGYGFGMRTEPVDTHGEVMPYQDDMMMQNGAMQHAMEEMMREFNGKHGAAYEKAFLEGMIVHHMGAIEMAEMLLTETDRPELIQMANDIITAQEREVQMMRGWHGAWFTQE